MRGVYVVSLGCQKNFVDTEVLLGNLKKYGFQIVSNLRDASLIMINTCAFIEAAKEEANSEIIYYSKLKQPKQKLIVVGCLPTRYTLDDLYLAVDRFISIKEYANLGAIIGELFNENNRYCYNPEERLLNSKDYVYIKISEGCNNNCGYCAIPLIRGKFVSRKKEYILNEIKTNYDLGIKEIILISQDTTSYGIDIGSSLIELLVEATQIATDIRIRLLYLYPSLVTDSLIELFKTNKQLIPFFDIPIQHSETNVLKSMNRRYTKEDLIALYHKLRSVPNSFIRTTLIVGYPTEAKEDFLALQDFITKYPFDTLGAFAYSKEDGTYAFNLKQINKKVIQKRLETIYETQNEAALALNKAKIGQTYPVYLDSYAPDKNLYIGRSIGHSPDDTTGRFYVYSFAKNLCNKLIDVKVVDACSLNFYGEYVKEDTND